MLASSKSATSTQCLGECRTLKQNFWPVCLIRNVATSGWYMAPAVQLMCMRCHRRFCQLPACPYARFTQGLSWVTSTGSALVFGADVPNLIGSAMHVLRGCIQGAIGATFCWRHRSCFTPSPTRLPSLQLRLKNTGDDNVQGVSSMATVLCCTAGL